jgi:glucan 1,3-beta-glucosidase
MAALSLLLGLATATPIRGVNLGGWLVMEPWITPKLFEAANVGVPEVNGSFAVVDEYTWRAAPDGNADRAQLLRQHWDEWVTEQHIEDLHQAGITHLRVPVAYWYWRYFSDEPFARFAGDHALALHHLTTLVNEWAKKRGMAVLVDLHTAPGSQNGFDNSGRKGPVRLLNGDNLSRWLEAVDAMTAWCVKELDQDVLFGIEILNEPVGFWGEMADAIKQHINPQGYATVRKHSKDLNVIFETGFMSFQDEANYTEPAYHNVWFDQHTYQAFGDGSNLLAMKGPKVAWPANIDEACVNDTKAYKTAPIKAFAGEWSLAITDCTLFLASGVSGGCNLAEQPGCLYNATPTRYGRDDVCQYYNRPGPDMDDDYKGFLRNFAHAQMDAFETAVGWFFWNFRTEEEHAPEWDYLMGVREGWMPKDAGARQPYCQQAIYV